MEVGAARESAQPSASPSSPPSYCFRQDHASLTWRNDTWWTETFLQAAPVKGPRKRLIFSQTQGIFIWESDNMDTLIRVYSTNHTGAIVMEDFQAAHYDLNELKAKLSQGEDVCAVILCHRSSCRVDRDMVRALSSSFDLDVSFLRQHFDHKDFYREDGCPQGILDEVREDNRRIRVNSRRKPGARWNPVRLPSESSDQFLRLSLEQDYVSSIS